jgi:DNA repair protein RecO (recombination protein O)
MTIDLSLLERLLSYLHENFMRIALQPAFILHHRPYRETSLLLDVLTQDYGRISLISRGVRSRRSPLKALLQPFNSLLLSWQGKTELMMLTGAEALRMPFQLRGDCLLSGFYLNELLVRLLQKHDPTPQLYTVYLNTLVELQASQLQQKTLRLFEKKLLEEIGYGLELTVDVSTDMPIAADNRYKYYPEQGFELYTEDDSNVPISMVFSGKSLLALAKEQLDDPECLRDAKRLMRIAFAPLLGSQPLYSRKLFIEVEK